MDYRIPQPIEGCKGCQGTGGAYSCPIHSSTLLARDKPKPVSFIVIRCPWCGKDIEYEGYRVETISSHALTGQKKE